MVCLKYTWKYEMSLRSLINLRIVLSVVLILLLGGATAVWQARQSVAKEVQSSMNLALQMIEFSFAQLPLSRRHGSTWLSQISALKQARHLKILIAEEGEKPIEFVTQRRVDELRAIPPLWFVNAVTTEYLTDKYNVSMADGSFTTIFITADPMDEIIEAWGESKAFFWSIFLMLLVIFLAVNLVFNSMLRTVKAILSGLHRVEQGEYGINLPHFKISEFDAIAVEINGLSSALNLSQKSNQALARHTMQIQESERRTMSKELHDEMGQSLTAIKAMAVASKQASSSETMAADSIIEICNHLSKVVRSMMKTLHPLSLAELGLGATLADLINECHRRYSDLDVSMDYDTNLETLSHEVAIHVYRIVQECLTNVVRHANASEVTIIVSKRNNTVWVTVADNGVGGKASQQGFGVLAMRERAESLGGQFSFESEKGLGVTVVVQLPYSEDIS
mgnify:CR=1 FL=1